MSPSHDSDFDALLSKVTEGLASDEDLARLEELLSGDADRQRSYFDWIATHLLLEKEGAIRAEVERTHLRPRTAVAAVSPPSRSLRDANRGVGFRWRGWLAIAATLLVAVGGLVLRWASQSKGVPIATVIDAVEVDGSPYELTAEGAVLDYGLPLHLSAGAVAVQMPSGAQLTVEGPASLTATGENCVHLAAGRLFARVPPAGVGFTVETPSGSLVDLGTEFGVVVDPLGITESFVYLGEVRAEAGDSTARLTAGTAIAIDREGRLGRPRRFADTEVTFTQTIDGTGYVEAIKRLQPLYLHRFSPNSKQRRFGSIIGSQRTSVSLRGGVYAAAGGPIVQPQTADGCLRFVGVESTTEVGSVGDALAESGAYTVALWIRVDESGPQGLAALTNQLGPDAELGTALRTTADGHVEHRCYSSDGSVTIQRSEAPAPIGVWSQIVATGRSLGELHLYINGESVSLPAEMRTGLREGCGRLLLGSGAGRRIDGHPDTGPLRGSIDEVALFDRQLTAREVRQLYREASASIPKRVL